MRAGAPMRHKFFGTGETGYHPLRKIRILPSGLRYAVICDFSVTYELVLSALMLTAAIAPRAWVGLLPILVITAFVIVAAVFRRSVQQRDQGAVRLRGNAAQQEDQDHRRHRRGCGGHQHFRVVRRADRRSRPLLAES
jgi:hypothetical protein